MYNIVVQAAFGMPSRGFRPFDANWWLYNVSLKFLFTVTSVAEKCLHNAQVIIPANFEYHGRTSMASHFHLSLISDIPPIHLRSILQSNVLLWIGMETHDLKQHKYR